MPIVPQNSLSGLQPYGPRPSIMPGISNSAGRAYEASARQLETPLAIERERHQRELVRIDDKYKRRRARWDMLAAGVKIGGELLKNGAQYEASKARETANRLLLEERFAKREAEQALIEFRNHMDREFYGYMDEGGVKHPGIESMRPEELSDGESGSERNNQVLSTIKALKSFKDSDAYRDMSEWGKELFDRDSETVFHSYEKRAMQLAMAGYELKRKQLQQDAATTAGKAMSRVTNYEGLVTGNFTDTVAMNQRTLIDKQFEEDGRVEFDAEGVPKFLGSTEQQKEQAKADYEKALTLYHQGCNASLALNVLSEIVATDDDAEAEEMLYNICNFAFYGTDIKPQRKEDGSASGYDWKAIELAANTAGLSSDSLSNDMMKMFVAEAKSVRKKRRDRMEQEDSTALRDAQNLVIDSLSGRVRDAKGTGEKIADLVQNTHFLSEEQRNAAIQKFSDQLLSPEITPLFEDIVSGDPVRVNAAIAKISADPEYLDYFQRHMKSREKAARTEPYRKNSSSIVKGIMDRVRLDGERCPSMEELSDAMKDLQENVDNIEPGQFRKTLTSIIRNMNFVHVCNGPRGAEQKLREYAALVAKRTGLNLNPSELLKYSPNGVPSFADNGDFVWNVDYNSDDYASIGYSYVFEMIKDYEILKAEDPDNELFKECPTVDVFLDRKCGSYIDGITDNMLMTLAATSADLQEQLNSRYWPAGAGTANTTYSDGEE